MQITKEWLTGQLTQLQQDRERALDNVARCGGMIDMIAHLLELIDMPEETTPEIGSGTEVNINDKIRDKSEKR